MLRSNSAVPWRRRSLRTATQVPVVCGTPSSAQHAHVLLKTLEIEHSTRMAGLHSTPPGSLCHCRGVLRARSRELRGDCQLAVTLPLACQQMGSEQQPGSQQPGSYLEACGVAAGGAAQPSSPNEDAGRASGAVGTGRLPRSPPHQARHSSMDEVRRLLCSSRLPHRHGLVFLLLMLVPVPWLTGNAGTEPDSRSRPEVPVATLAICRSIARSAALE